MLRRVTKGLDKTYRAIFSFKTSSILTLLFSVGNPNTWNIQGKTLLSDENISSVLGNIYEYEKAILWVFLPDARSEVSKFGIKVSHHIGCAQSQRKNQGLRKAETNEIQILNSLCTWCWIMAAGHHSLESAIRAFRVQLQMRVHM